METTPMDVDQQQEDHEDGTCSSISLERLRVYAASNNNNNNNMEMEPDEGSDFDEDDILLSNKIEEAFVNKASKKHNPKLLSIQQLVAVFCCSFCCLGGLLVSSMSDSRQYFQGLTATEKHQYVLDTLKRTSSFDENGEYEGSSFYIEGLPNYPICLNAWLAILGLASSTFYAIRKRFIGGSLLAPLPNGRGHGIPSMEAIAWIERYAAQFGDKLPDSLNIHLPVCLTKTDIFNDYKTHMGAESLTVSESTFRRLWKQYFSHVKAPKASKFNKCDTCVNIQDKLSRTKGKKARMALASQRDAHLKQQNTERRKYYKHIGKAKDDSDRYMSIIIDSMDQAKTMLPRFLLKAKCMSSLWLLKVHLVGVIIHGIAQYGFFDVFQWSHGSNLTITCLMMALCSLKKIPPTLYVQMDNCAKENKNRYTFGFFALLVQMGVFRKIKVSFLMVGHTHEDVDRMFSKFSVWLARKSVLTLMTLMEAFEKCLNPSPIAAEIENIYDVSSWITPHLETISGHSRPHCFKFVKENGHTRLYYKQWSTDQTWERPGTGIVLKSIPEDSPLSIKPDYGKADLDKVSAGIRKIQHFMHKEEDKVWWENLPSTRKQEEDDFEQIYQWPMQKLLDASSNLHPDEAETAIPNPPNAPDKIPPVRLGKQRATKETGSYALLDIPMYQGEWPQVGQVISKEKDSVTIHWMRGAKSTPWRLCSRRVGRSYQPWLETFNSSKVFHYFDLTPSGHLPKEAKEASERYAEEYL